MTVVVRMRRAQGEGDHERDDKMINYWTTFSKQSFARGEELVVCGLLCVAYCLCVCIRAGHQNQLVRQRENKRESKRRGGGERGGEMREKER